MNKLNKSILFNTPDGQTFLAGYNNKKEMICCQIGKGSDIKFSDMYPQFPELLNRVKQQLENENNVQKCKEIFSN